MSRLVYFIRETLISLRRNLLMTIAGIITVAISLFLFGGILLVSATVDHGTQQWKHGIELEIFMKTGATKNQVDAVEAELKADPQVKNFTHLTQAGFVAIESVVEAVFEFGFGGRRWCAELQHLERPKFRQNANKQGNETLEDCRLLVILNATA